MWRNSVDLSSIVITTFTALLLANYLVFHFGTPFLSSLLVTYVYLPCSSRLLGYLKTSLFSQTLNHSRVHSGLAHAAQSP